MNIASSVNYELFCDPRVLRSTPAEFAQPEPPVDMEADVLTAFADAQGKVMLREREWGGATALAKGLRSIRDISSPEPGWLEFPISELRHKKVRRTLWWASIVAPLTFVLQPECPSAAWSWFMGAWQRVTPQERAILLSAHRAMLDAVAEYQLWLDFANRATPHSPMVGFFDEGCQAVVVGSVGSDSPGAGLTVAPAKAPK